MRTWTLTRHNDSDLVFEGEHILTMDDRQWLGVTPNWWQLSLYQTDEGQIVLGSVYYQNFPMRRTLHGALVVDTLDDIARCLREHCNAPDIIVDALMTRAKRTLCQPKFQQKTFLGTFLRVPLQLRPTAHTAQHATA